MRVHRSRTVTSALAVLAACCLLLSGCSDSSTGPSESDYLDPTSPENVLLNFGRSYNERNVDEFLACMSEDFRFHFTEYDQQGWPEFPPWFYRSDERQVHENMFGDHWGVESIVLTLIPTSVETITGSGRDLTESDVVVITVATDLRIRMLDDMTFMASDYQDFYFREVYGTDVRDGEVLWEMFEWYDLDAEESGGERVVAGWGGIKFHFLESLSEPSRRTSPAEVIDQLQAAYNAMSLVDYMDCLSEDFVFYPCGMDVLDPELDIPPEWYRSMEHIIHTNMFGSGSSVTSVELTLTNTYAFWDEGDPEDPLDDVYSHTEDVELWVHLNDGYISMLADAPQQYLLRVDRDEQGPYGEPMWEIFEWYDLDSEGVGSESNGRENTTWGGIKAMFR